MESIILKIVSTSKGWLLRQGLKVAATVGAAASTAILTHARSLPIDPSQTAEIAAQAQQIATGVTGLAVSVGVALVEGLLSKKASKIAAR